MPSLKRLPACAAALFVSLLAPAVSAQQANVPAIVGASTFTQSYLSSIAVGLVVTDGDFDNHSAWTLIPVAGPWVTLAKRAELEQATTGATDTIATAGLISTAVIQTVGLIVVLAAVATDSKETTIAVTPLLSDHADGLALTCHF